MARTKADFTGKNSIRKERKIMVRFPRRSLPTIKKLLIKYDLKSMQALFDALVIGGLVFRRSEIIEFIRKHRPKYEELNTQVNLAKLGKTDKPDLPDMYGVNMVMYHQDHVAFKDYIIEENIKQQWVWSILFEDGFAQEADVVIKLIKRQTSLEISSRKKAIARLSNDEYIRVLPEQDANTILEQLTQEYDERQFDDSLTAVVAAKIKLQESLQEALEEEELEDDFSSKISSLRNSRTRQIESLSKPKLEE